MANGSNIDIALQAGLDLTASEQQLIQDIKLLQQRLQAAGLLKITMITELDEKLIQAVKQTVDGSKKDIKSAGKNLGEALADGIIQGYNINNKEIRKQIQNLTKQLYNIRLTEFQGGGENPELLNVWNQLGDLIIKNANIMQSRMGIYDQFYEWFKKIGNIKIPQIVIEDLDDDWNNLRKSFASKFVTKKDGVELDSIYGELSSKFKDLFPETTDQAQQFRNLVEALRTYRADVDKLEPIQATDLVEFEDSVWNDLSARIADMSRRIQQELESATNNEVTEESAAQISEEAEAMQAVEQAATEAAREKERFADANREVADTAEATADAVDDEQQAMMNLNDIHSILANINLTGQQGVSVFQMFGNVLNQAFYSYTAANLLQDAIHQLIASGEDAIQTVKELNDAAVDLQMATSKNYDDVKAMMSAYNELGQANGALTTEVSAGADAWLRQGHNIEDTNTLLRDSMMLSKVAKLSAEDSTKYLTSAMQGYKTSVEDVIRISDKLVSIDLVSATDAGGLAEAMSRTAEGANLAGISMDRLLGMIAAVGEVTQKSMSSIGESYKTIFSRMRDVKDNKLQVVGDDGEIEDLSNVEIVLNSLGIKLRKSNKEFRNFQDVLDDVAGNWNKYSSVQQAAIAKAFSGVRQQENFLVMMENWDKVLEYTSAAENGAGTTEQKFEFYLDSLEAKTKSLQASLENLASVTISDELYASVLDLSKGMVDATAESGILKGALAGLATAGAVYALQQMVTFARGAAQEFSNLSEALNMVRTGNVGAQQMQTLIDLTGGLTQSQTRLLLSTNNLTDAQKIAILMNQGMSQAEAQHQIQLWGVANAQNGVARATITLRSAMQGLWTTLLANPLVLVTAAITAGTMAWTKYKQSQEKARQAAKEAAEEANTLSNKLSDLTGRYLELSEAVKTDTSVRSDFLDVQSQLLEKLGLEGESIDTLTEKYGSLSAAIKQVTLDSLKESQLDLLAGVDVARDKLLKTGKDGLFGQKNSLSVTGDDAIKAFEILEDAGIMSAGSYGAKGGTFNLLGDESTVDGILENYEKIDSALKALRDSDKFTAEELSKNPVYSKLYNRWKEMKDAVGEYNTAIDNLNRNQAQYFTLESLKGMEVPDTEEEFNQFRDGLVETATASKEFIGSEEEITAAVDDYLASIPQFTDFYKEEMQSVVDMTGEVGDKVGQALNKEQMIATINGLSEGFEELDKIYKSITDSDPFDFKLLDDDKFKENFSGLDGYAEFVETISSNSNDIGACKNAFNSLVGSWLNSTGVLESVTDDTKNLTIAMLENMGVANAEELVAWQLAVSKQKANEATIALVESELKETYGHINVADGISVEEQALAQLALEKIHVNNQQIDTSADIDNVISLANAAGSSAKVLAELAKAKSVFAQIEAGTGVGMQFLNDGTYDQMKAVVDSIENGTYDYEFQIDPNKFKYSGGTKSNSGSGSGSGSTSKVKEEFDWIKRKYDYLQRNHDIYSEMANDETVSYYERIAAVKEMIAWDKKRLSEASQDVAKYSAEWKKYMIDNLTADEANLVMYGGDEIAKMEAKAGTEEAKRIDRLKEGVEIYDILQEALERQRETQKEVNDHLREELQLQQDIIQARQEQLRSEIDLADAHISYIEASGGVVTEGYYKEQIRLSKEISDSYEDQIDNLREQQSMVDENSAEYYSLEAQIIDCESAILECKTQQEEWNEAIKRLPVERMQKYINMLKAIKQELEDYLDYQETIGQITTKDQYQQLMELNKEQIDKLQEQATELQGLLNDYKYGSDKFNDVAEELSDIQNETANLVNEMQEYNNAILQIPITKLEEANEELERYSNILSGIMDDYNSALTAVTDLLDSEVNALEDLKQQNEDTYAAQIEPLEKQLELLEQTYVARSKELALEQALYDLERAKNQQNVLAIRDGKEVYISDPDAVRDAEQNLQDAEMDKLKYDIQSNIDYLEQQRDEINAGYDEEIDRLTEIENKWKQIKEDAEGYANTLKADTTLGDGWEDKILSGNDDDIYQMFKNLYESTNQQQVHVQEQTTSNERVAKMMQVFVDRFIDGSITYEQALSGISELSASINQGYTSLEQLNGLMNLDGLSGMAEIATSMQGQINESVSMLAQYIDVAKVNNDAIAAYTSTWEEMSEMIKEQLDALKKAAEELEEWVKNQKYKGYSSDSDGGGGNIDYTDHESNGTITSGMNGGSYSDDRHSSQSSSGSPSSANDDQDEDDGPGVHHKGVLSGYFGQGSSDYERYKDIRMFTTEELEPNEVIVKGLKDELALNKEQQETAVNNIRTLTNPVLNLSEMPDDMMFQQYGVRPVIEQMQDRMKNAGLTEFAKTEVSSDNSVTMGNIILHEVQRPDQLADALMMQFPTLLRNETRKGLDKRW